MTKCIQSTLQLILKRGLNNNYYIIIHIFLYLYCYYYIYIYKLYNIIIIIILERYYQLNRIITYTYFIAHHRHR